MFNSFAFLFFSHLYHGSINYAFGGMLSHFVKESFSELFVHRGARINRRDKDNYTPLLLAATYGNVETVELLLQKGADYTVMDKYDKTAIFMAAEENKLDVLQVRLARNCFEHSYSQIRTE